MCMYIYIYLCICIYKYIVPEFRNIDIINDAGIVTKALYGFSSQV